MIEHAFNYVDKVYFDIGEYNFRSRKAVEKLGAVLFSSDDNGMVIYRLDEMGFLASEKPSLL